MNRYKPYIIGMMIGVFFMLAFGISGYIVLKKSKPLIKKVIVKLSDWRFRHTRKAAQDRFIADFESPEDFKKFAESSVNYEVSKEAATSGSYSAKVTFKKAHSPSFRMEQYFDKEKSLMNWAPYESFVFDIYNPQDSVERIILQIKDTSENKYKQDIYLEPKSWATIDVGVPLLRHSLSVYRIGQINFFRWDPPHEAVFYIDNIRLVATGAKIKKSIFDPEFADFKEAVYAVKDSAHSDAGSGRIVTINMMNPHFVKLKDFPARGGIPFPKGGLKNTSELVMKDAAGNEIPFQSKVMAQWPDGTVKWLLLDIAADAEADSGTPYFIYYPTAASAQNKESMIVQDAGSITVNTGKVRFAVSKKNFRLFDKLWLNDKQIISEGSDLTLQFRGDVYRSSSDKESQLTIEEDGPLVAGLKAEGWFVNKTGKKFCKYLVRIKAYKNESFLRVFHTFIFTGYPENKYHYLYKGKRLPKNETIEEVAVEMRMPEIFQDGVLTFAGDGKVMQAKNLDEKFRIVQSKDAHFEVFKSEKQRIGEGNKLEGWLDFSGAEHGICAIVRKLWQQYPKGFEVDAKNKLLKIKLWPREAGDLDLKTTEKTPGPEDVARGSAFGLAKTHELVFYFHEGDYKTAKAREMAQVVQEPPLLMADPQWFSESRVLGRLTSHKEGSYDASRYEEGLEKLFDWADRQKKTFKWYGMLDFGDTLSWYRQEGYDESYDEWGWHPEGRWGWFNCEAMGTHYGALLQFLRTGKYKYFEFGEDLSRHIMDVDTCHYNTVKEDKRLRGIYQDYSQPGSMHRHSGDHWGGRSDEASHTNLNGILLYYYITGNDRALDVAKEIGEYFLKHPIIYFKHPDVAPHRAMANILWGEVALYEATGDERLKKDADYWADVFFQGQNRNGSFNENYNPIDKIWHGDPAFNYMTGYTLPALIEYHALTGNRAIKESIVRLTEYLQAHEEYAPVFHGLAYSYYLTGNAKFLEASQVRLDTVFNSQRNVSDPIFDGMIYQKPYYMRVVEFLAFTPYAFEALLASQRAEGQEVNSE